MRIADKMQYRQVDRNISKNRTDMADLQNQAATQKRINKPSDDPLASARVLTNRTEERGANQYIKNINQAKSFLEYTDQSLSELSEVLMRAKELAISQSSDANGTAQTRQIAALEVEQIYNQSVQIGNRKLGDRYIFGGFQTQQMPFNQLGEYSGDDEGIKVQTHKDAFMAMNVAGSKVFLGQGLNPDGIARQRVDTPRSVEELEMMREDQKKEKEIENEKHYNHLEIRAPASFKNEGRVTKDPVDSAAGVNVFNVLRGLDIALRTNDKEGVQASLDAMDDALNQVVMTRADVGARLMSLNGTLDTLQKSIVDNKIQASQLEDADVFQVVSDINRTDAALKATMETSGKMIQPSLLDFLK